MRTHGAASAAGFEALRTNVRMVWGSFLIAKYLGLTQETNTTPKASTSTFTSPQPVASSHGLAFPKYSRVNPRSPLLPVPPVSSQAVAVWPLQDILLRIGAFVHDSIILILPPPPASPTWLQYYWNTIAQYLNLFRPTVFTPSTMQYWAWQYRVKAKSHYGRVNLG